MLRRMATVTLWIGTRKGAFALRADAQRRRWSLKGPQFLGHTIHHIVQDPRQPQTLLMAAKTGHLGPTVYRSEDRGRGWQEVGAPPAFRRAAAGEPVEQHNDLFGCTVQLAARLCAQAQPEQKYEIESPVHHEVLWI